MQVTKMTRQTILGIKPYVPGKPIEEVKRELGLADVIKLASNENPLGPGEKAIAAICREAADAQLYPDGACFQLRTLLAEKLQVQMENLIVGNGSDELLKMLGETFLCPDDECIVPDPTFSEYGFVATLMGAKTIKVPVNPDFSYDLAGMRAAITEKTKMIFLCTPNNPVGNIIPQVALEAFLADLPEQLIVVMDEAYAEYVDDPDYPNSLTYLSRYENLIILRTFSKIYGLGGLRVGYGIANKELIDLLNRVKEPFNVNKLAQAAAAAALGDRAHIMESLQVNQAGKAYLQGEFERLGFFYVPTETNFVFVQIGMDARVFFDELLKKGIIIRTGDIFGYPDFIRVTIGTMAQNKRFIQEMKEILNK